MKGFEILADLVLEQAPPPLPPGKVPPPEDFLYVSVEATPVVQRIYDELQQLIDSSSEQNNPARASLRAIMSNRRSDACRNLMCSLLIGLLIKISLKGPADEAEQAFSEFIRKRLIAQRLAAARASLEELEAWNSIPRVPQLSEQYFLLARYDAASKRITGANRTQYIFGEVSRQMPKVRTNLNMLTYSHTPPPQLLIQAQTGISEEFSVSLQSILALPTFVGSVLLGAGTGATLAAITGASATTILGTITPFVNTSLISTSATSLMTGISAGAVLGSAFGLVVGAAIIGGLTLTNLVQEASLRGDIETVIAAYQRDLPLRVIMSLEKSNALLGLVLFEMAHGRGRALSFFEK